VVETHDHEGEFKDQVSDSPLFRTSKKGNDDEEFRSYGPFGAGLYPAWIASCSVMYLPFLVVP
jgi:hypothetical protein